MTTRNVVLLVLDTVRKDVFDERASRLRERSAVSFERAYAPSSWTVPSHASMFTGKLPHEHGVHAHDINYTKVAVEDTFLGALAHRTIGVSANSFLSPQFGFNGLFDEFTSLQGNEELLPGGIDSAEFMDTTDATGIARYLAYFKTAAAESALVPSLANALYMKLNNAGLGRSIPRFGDYGARAALKNGYKRAPSSSPFFLFVNLVDAHEPHEVLRGYETDVPKNWTSREHDIWEVNTTGIEHFPTYLNRFDDLYGCAVEYLDDRVDSFVDSVQSKTAGETTVIVTADHGEELGRENERTLGHKIPSAAVSHVPLEVINPPPTWQLGHVNDVVSLLDLGRLVRSIVDDEPPDIARDIAPVERLGDTHPPVEQTAFWNRGIRTTFGPDEAYEWDSEGARNRYEIGKSTERLVDNDATIPDLSLTQYSVDLDTAKSDAAALGAPLGDDIDGRTQKRLEDLGYM